MVEERRYSPEGLLRINVDAASRDLSAVWNDTPEIIVRGTNLDAMVQADELFVSCEGGHRQNHKGVELEIPAQPFGCEFKVEHGDVHLSGPQGKVDVKADNGDVSIQNGNGTLAVASGRGDTKIAVFQGDVTVNSGSGDASLSNIDGEATIRAGRGEISMNGGRGATTVASGSGDIRLRDRHCDTFTAASGSGDVTVSGGSLGRSEISTASGDIKCDAALSVSNYDLTASSGDISLSIPRDLVARVDAATTRGSVTTDLPLVAINQRGPRNPHGKRLVGSTGDDRERAEITLRTSSGDIDVRFSSKLAASQPSRDVFESADDPVTMPATSATTPSSLANQNASATDDQPGSIDAAPSGPRASEITDDRKRAILSALSDGAISVEEAGMLLDAIDRPSPNTSGA